MAPVFQTDGNSSAKFRPHLGTCLILGRNIAFDISAHPATALLSALIRDYALALSLPLSALSEVHPPYYLTDTDSKANQFGAPQSAGNLRHTSVTFGPGCNCCLVEGQNFIGKASCRSVLRPRIVLTILRFH